MSLVASFISGGLVSLVLYFIVRTLTHKKRTDTNLSTNKVGASLSDINELQLALLNSFPAYISFKDKELAYIWANTPFSELLEIETSEIKGKSDFDYFSEDVALELKSEDQRLQINLFDRS